MDILDILNFVFLAVIPLLIKFMNDLNKLYSKIVEHKTEINNLKEDIKELRECLAELKKIMLLSKK